MQGDRSPNGLRLCNVSMLFDASDVKPTHARTNSSATCITHPTTYYQKASLAHKRSSQSLTPGLTRLSGGCRYLLVAAKFSEREVGYNDARPILRMYYS